MAEKEESAQRKTLFDSFMKFETLTVKRKKWYTLERMISGFSMSISYPMI